MPLTRPQNSIRKSNKKCPIYLLSYLIHVLCARFVMARKMIFYLALPINCDTHTRGPPKGHNNKSNNLRIIQFSPLFSSASCVRSFVIHHINFFLLSLLLSLSLVLAVLSSCATITFPTYLHDVRCMWEITWRHMLKITFVKISLKSVLCVCWYWERQRNRRENVRREQGWNKLDKTE